MPDLERPLYTCRVCGGTLTMRADGRWIHDRGHDARPHTADPVVIAPLAETELRYRWGDR